MSIDEAAEPSASYTDAKGRTRWHENDALAGQLKDLADYLIVSGYDPDHAARYPKLAYIVSRHPEPMRVLLAQERLSALPGVGKTVAGILTELITTGTTAKLQNGDGTETYRPASLSVLEMTRISGLGAQTVRRLWTEHGINSLAALRTALDDGTLSGFKGIGPKLIQTIRERTALSNPPKTQNTK